MATFMQHQGHRLEIEVDRIEFTTALPQPDPTWTYTDHVGHEHTYGSKTNPYPTLVHRESEPYWCTDCNDEHTDSWLECPLCGEKIEPGTYIDTSPQYVAGPTAYRIDGRLVSKEEGDAMLAQIRAAHEEEKRTRALDKAKERARHAEQAMRDEGMSEDQIQRILNRMVHGDPDGPA